MLNPASNDAILGRDEIAAALRGVEAARAPAQDLTSDSRSRSGHRSMLAGPRGGKPYSGPGGRRWIRCDRRHEVDAHGERNQDPRDVSHTDGLPGWYPLGVAAVR